MRSAAFAYFEALKSGDFGAVQAIASARCDGAITEGMVAAAANQLAGAEVEITVLSVGPDTASANINSTASKGNPGTGTQFRLESGSWLWDGCP